MWDSIKASSLEERGIELDDLLRSDSFKGELKTRRLDSSAFEQALVDKVKAAAVEQGYLSEQQVMSIRDELKAEERFRAVTEQDIERSGTAIHAVWQKDQTPQNIVSGDTAGLLRDVLVKLKEVLDKDSKRDTMIGFLPVMKNM